MEDRYRPSLISLRETSEGDSSSTPFLQPISDLKTYPLIRGNLSPLMTSVFLMAALNGAAVLALPSSLKNTGWAGLPLFFVSCFFSLYTGL